MPIKHLQSERPASFPCIGKLRKGGPKQTNQNGKEVMGRDLDHFRFTSEDQQAQETFATYYGAEPKAVSVYLPFATVDENFAAWLEEYRAGGLVRRCDGESCVFSRNEKGQPITTPTPCLKPRCTCKQVGRLAVIIPQLARLAYVTVETHSVWDIISLTENLQAAQVLRGDLRGIPFILSRREREISTPAGEDGKRARRKKSLLFIEPDPTWVQRQLEAMRVAALPQVDQPLLTMTPLRLVDKQTGEILDGSTAQWTDVDEDEEEEEMSTPWDDAPSASQPQALPATARAPRGTIANPLPPVTATGPTPIDPATLAELTALGISKYGEQWPARESAIALGASKGAVNTLAALTYKEGEELLVIFRKRAMEQQTAAQEAA